jgi:hypothetical protein
LPMSPESGGKRVREIASYFVSVIPPPRIGLLRLGPMVLNQAGPAIAASLERMGKRVLLLRSDHQRDAVDLIAVRSGGFREGPLADWKTCDERLGREERASDLLVLLLSPESPSLPRLLSALNLLVLLLPGERGEALGSYRSAKRALVNRRAVPCGVFAAGDGEAAAAVLERFLLGLHVFLGLQPLNFGTTASTCAQEIVNLQLESPAEPYFRGNS